MNKEKYINGNILDHNRLFEKFDFSTNQVVSPYDDKVMGNPIGWLQEMCMSRRWPPPSYEMEHEEGLPHERQFTIACQVTPQEINMFISSF